MFSDDGAWVPIALYDRVREEMCAVSPELSSPWGESFVCVPGWRVISGGTYTAGGTVLGFFADSGCRAPLAAGHDIAGSDLPCEPSVAVRTEVEAGPDSSLVGVRGGPGAYRYHAVGPEHGGQVYVRRTFDGPCEALPDPGGRYYTLGPELTSDELVTFELGQRGGGPLRLNVIETRGAVVRVVGWTDGNEACGVARLPDGTTRCVGYGRPRGAYADPGCTDPLYLPSPLAPEPVPAPREGWRVVACEAGVISIDTVHSLEPRAPSVLYEIQIVDGAPVCVPSTLDVSAEWLGRAAPLASEAFPPLEVVIE